MEHIYLRLGISIKLSRQTTSDTLVEQNAFYGLTSYKFADIWLDDTER